MKPKRQTAPIWIAIWAMFIIGYGFLSSPVQAHTKSKSYSNWQIEPQMDGAVKLEFYFTVSSLRVTQLGQLYENLSDLDKVLEQHLNETLFVHYGTRLCERQALKIRDAARGNKLASGAFFCPAAQETALDLYLSIGSFFIVSSTHMHVAQLELGSESASEDNISQIETKEIVITANDHKISLVPGSQLQIKRNGALSFIWQGMTHVWGGLDHLAFLLVLLLMAGRPWRIVKAITGFTLGHSLSLAIVSFGLVQPIDFAVEALIGYSVAYGAIIAAARYERSNEQSRAHPHMGNSLAVLAFALLPLFLLVPIFASSYFSFPIWVLLGLALFALVSLSPGMDGEELLGPAWLAALFGIVHGAGFAGVLIPLELERMDLVWALLNFNIGVELGQLAVCGLIGLLFWPLARLKLSGWMKPVQQLVPSSLSAILTAAGIFWFVSRVLA